MFNEEELNFIASICIQLSFKSGQMQQLILTEQILEKIKNKDKKNEKNS